MSFASLFKCQKGHLSMFSQVCPLNCWLVWEIVGNGSGLSATKAKTWNRILVTEISYFPSNTYFFCKSWQALETKYLIFALDFKTGQILDHLPWYISFCRKKRGKCKLEEKNIVFLAFVSGQARTDGWSPLLLGVTNWIALYNSNPTFGATLLKYSAYVCRFFS